VLLLLLEKRKAMVDQPSHILSHHETSRDILGSPSSNRGISSYLVWGKQILLVLRGRESAQRVKHDVTAMSGKGHDVLMEGAVMEYYISSPCFSFKVKHDEVLIRGCSISGSYVDAESDEESTDQGMLLVT
jgi:hypothetical protein